MSQADAPTEPNEGFDILDTARALAPRRAATRWAATSHPGRRGTNQDAWRVVEDCLFLIADGMGGLGGGGRAARTALDSLAEQPGAPEVTDWQEAFAAADDAVVSMATRELLADAGTTVAALVAFESHALISHLGDSRIHRLRDGHLTTHTQDHSVSGDLDIDPSTLERPAAWRLDALTAFIGAGRERVRDTALAVSARPGDRFLLTTDGVHSVLSTDELAHHAAAGTSDDAALALVEAAGAGGSVDDRTVLVVDFGPLRPIAGGERP